MTVERRNIKTIIKNKRKKLMIITMSLIILSIGSVTSYTLHKNNDERQLKNEIDIQQQKQQIEDVNERLQKIEDSINTLNETLEQQKPLLMKTSARLTQKHITVASLKMVDTGEYIDCRPQQTSRSFTRPTPYNFKILTNSAVTAYELNQTLAGTNLEGLGECFVKAELETGVNAVFLTSLAIHESSWGKSFLSNDRNNLFGFGAYDSSPNSAVSYSSKGECIEQVARFLADNYGKESGSYYTNGTIAGVNSIYASDENWKNDIFNLMRTIETKSTQI